MTKEHCKERKIKKRTTKNNKTQKKMNHNMYYMTKKPIRQQGIKGKKKHQQNKEVNKL